MFHFYLSEFLFLTKGLLTFSGDAEMEYWREIGWCHLKRQYDHGFTEEHGCTENVKYNQMFYANFLLKENED